MAVVRVSVCIPEELYGKLVDTRKSGRKVNLSAVVVEALQVALAGGSVYEELARVRAVCEAAKRELNAL